MSDTDMAGSEVVDPSADTVVGRLSWVEYLKVIIVYTIVFGLLYGTHYIAGQNDKLSYLDDYHAYLIIFFALLFIYRIALVWSHKIYVNSSGVWYAAGVLPWAQSGNGVRWGDMDMPFYYSSFLNWVTNSYKIEVRHKYTNDIDFSMNNVWRGRHVCALINDAHAHYL